MPKIVFANQLRGLAAAFVAGSHFVGVFWVMRDFVGLATASPVQAGVPPGILSLFGQPWLNFGPFGVGVFFLISGFVIPLSLDQHTRGSFLLARVLRVYPTYIAALLIEVAVLHADAAYWGRPFPYGNWTIISNGLLIYNAVGLPSIDLVNWTLCIELKFYLLMMFLAPQIRRGSVLTVLLTGIVITTANTALTRYPLTAGSRLSDLRGQFGTESTYVVFMLIGVLFNFHLRGLLRRPAFVAGSAGMLVLFVISSTQSALRVQFPIVTVNYLYAVVLFGSLYWLRAYARSIWILDFIASISFPFYLIHSLVGFSILKILMIRFGLSYAPAVCIALVIVVCVATALHLTIEIKSIAMGRTLSRRRKSPASSPLVPRRIPVA